MIHLAPVLTLASLLAPTQDTGETRDAVASAPFPPSTALAERVSPDGLAALGELVQSFVEQGEIVGAELLVIVHGRTILHEGYGWRDREAEVPMRPGGVFCVRSMTKPLIGAATWMLIESGKLAQDDRVAEVLPAFDVDGQRDITVGHLLRHQSGLSMSMIMARDPRTLTSLRSVADLGGSSALEFEPGTAAPLEGSAGELLRSRDPFLRFGGRRRAGEKLTVIQELQSGDALTLLVRAGDTSGPAPTIYVDQESGRVVRMDGMTPIEGLGSVGSRARFSDFREVGGALLPWRVEVELAHPLIGTILNVVEGVETGAEVPEGWFELAE